MSAQKAIPLNPRSVTYRDVKIKLIHRPKTNDWQYEIVYTREMVLSQHAPRYAAALSLAKKDIDALHYGAKR